MLDEKDLQAIRAIINDELSTVKDFQLDYEVLEARISALEAMVKKLNREVAQLKKAQ